MSRKTEFDQIKKRTCTFLLIRHGQTVFNKEGRFYGRIDAPLNEVGEQQAMQLVERLQHRPIDYLYASTLQRAIKTAEPIATHKNLPLQQDPQLMELDHGDWEGLLFHEAMNRDQEKWDLWRAGQIGIPHGGETMDDGILRARNWVESCQQSLEIPSPTIAVVAHGGILQAMMCALMETPSKPMWQYHFSNITVAEVACYPLGNTLLSFS